MDVRNVQNSDHSNPSLDNILKHPSTQRPSTFSSRTSWSHERNTLTQLLEAKRGRGEPVLDLTLSNPTVADFPVSPEHVLHPLADPGSLRYDPHPWGLVSAREAIAEFYARQQVSVDPSNILLTASTSEAYSYLFSLLCDPGDAILVPTPSYPLFDFLAQLHDVSLCRYRLDYDGEWHVDFESLTRSITSTTRALILLHPNNPTGSYVSVQERQRVNDLAISHRLALIVDEVFHPYAFETPPPSFAQNSETLTFTLNGISKLFGLPQMKLAWTIVSGPDALTHEARHRLEFIADTFLSVSTPIQQALLSYLQHLPPRTEEIKTRVRRNYQMLLRTLEHSAITPLQCQGGWNAILRVPAVQTDEQWALHLLQECSLLVHPGSFYHFSEGCHLVVSLLSPAVDFDRGIEILRDYVTQWR